MVEVSIFSVVIVGPGLPSVIVLAPLGSRAGDSSNTKLVLPIWIGKVEADAILATLQHQVPPRPMPHDLMANVIRVLDADMSRIVIDRVRNSTFYATIYLSHGDREISLDARPSDSIALALKLGAPIFVDEDVMNSSAQRFVTKLEDGKTMSAESEASMQEFREFLSSISPEDFK